MAEAFDPYVQWLGIEGGRRPGNHYELLGINLYEGDPAVVARAADTLTARIRSIRPGPHVAEWQRLLDAVAGAKRSLLDPTAKATYDGWLRGQTASPSRPVQRPAQVAGTGAPSPGTDQAAQAEATPPVFSPDTPAASFPSPVSATRRTTKAKPSAAQLAVYALTSVFLLMAAVFATMLYQQHQGGTTDPGSASATRPRPTQRPGLPRPPQRSGASTAGTPEKPGPNQASPSEKRPPRVEDTKPQAPPETASKPQTKPSASGRPQAKPNADPPPSRPAAPKQTAMPGAPVDGQRQEAFREAVADLRFSLSEHDVAGAREHLRKAGANAQTPPERAEIDRLDTLLGHLEEFWKGMSRIVARLESAEVLPVGDTFVAIVESSPEQLIVKVAGQLRTYQIDRMPSPLAQVLANTGFADDPATKVLVGTYFLVDPQGDPARTRQLWQEAARAGIDVKDLLPELDRWTGAATASGSPAAQKTAATPDPQKLQQAEQTVREKYQAEYAQATSIAGKARLAKRLLGAVATTGDDSDLRFVLLREARDLAVAAGDCESAMPAIDQMAALYRVDSLAMKTAALAEAVENARGASAQKTIAQNALELTGQAVEARRLDEASKLAEVANSAARKSNNRPLMQQALLVVRQVEALRGQADPRPAAQDPAVPPEDR